MEWYEKFEKIREYISDEEIINTALSNFFTSDQMNDFCEQMIIDYDLESEFEDEY